MGLTSRTIHFRAGVLRIQYWLRCSHNLRIVFGADLTCGVAAVSHCMSSNTYTSNYQALETTSACLHTQSFFRESLLSQYSRTGDREHGQEPSQHCSSNLGPEHFTSMIYNNGWTAFAPINRPKVSFALPVLLSKNSIYVQADSNLEHASQKRDFTRPSMIDRYYSIGAVSTCYLFVEYHTRRAPNLLARR